MARSTSKSPGGRRRKVSAEPGTDSSGDTRKAGRNKAGKEESSRRNGGWREIEARREKAALRASLADVWDEDFDLDEEILAELDHTAEFFTTQEDPEVQDFEDEDDEDFFEDEEV